MPEYFRDDVGALLVSQDTARHRAADKFPVIHKKIPHAETDVVRKYFSLAGRQGFHALSSTLGRGPPIQGGEKDALAGDVQSVAARYLGDLLGAELLEIFLLQDVRRIQIDYIQTLEQKFGALSSCNTNEYVNRVISSLEYSCTSLIFILFLFVYVEETVLLNLL